MIEYRLSVAIFFFLKVIYLFIYLWLHWVFVAARFSLRWLLLLWSTGSRRAGFSSCGSRAQLLHGKWDLPGPGLEPGSPALAGGFLTTAPPGKSRIISIFKKRRSLPLSLYLSIYLSNYLPILKMEILSLRLASPKSLCSKILGLYPIQQSGWIL